MDTVFQILESIKADYRNKNHKKKPSSGIDDGIKNLGVALKFKLKQSELCEDKA